MSVLMQAVSSVTESLEKKPQQAQDPNEPNERQHINKYKSFTRVASLMVWIWSCGEHTLSPDRELAKLVPQHVTFGALRVSIFVYCKKRVN